MQYKIDNVKNYSETRGWLCGQFFPKDSINYSRDLEVKFSIMQPGAIIPEHYHPKGKQIDIIIEGAFRFLLNGKKHVVKDGDFVIINHNVRESVIKVLKPTTLISIRTPSVPNNKIEIDIEK